MIKHIGKHGDRKVAIVFREVPGEDHMCLVVYPETLPINIHDGIMKLIESDIAQTAENLGDALFRSLLPDGRPMLQTLHAEGMIKKVPTRQVTVTPTPSSHVNLEEMNTIISKMKMGEQAAKELADLDANRGMTGKVRPRDDFGREVGAPDRAIRQGSPQVAGSDAAKALDDSALASTLQQQAQRMAAEAKGLLAESDRLMKEAAAMLGATAEPAPKRTRSKKQAVADAAR